MKIVPIYLVWSISEVTMMGVKILRYCNRDGYFNEIVVVNSDDLRKFRGLVFFDSSRISWLGYDIAACGNTSLISNGLFFKPVLFSIWIDMVNENGLFEDKEEMDEYIKNYLFYAGRKILEDWGVTAGVIDAIRIGRILHPETYLPA